MSRRRLRQPKVLLEDLVTEFLIRVEQGHHPVGLVPVFLAESRELLDLEA